MDGTLNQEWFVSQASKALMVSNDAVRCFSGITCGILSTMFADCCSECAGRFFQ